MNEKIKYILAIGISVFFIVVSFFVVIFVYGGKYGHSFFPSLIPIFGWEFGLIFMIIQMGFCYYFDTKKGLLLIIGIWIVTIPLSYICLKCGFSYSISHHLNLSKFDRIITGASCVSAIVLGILTIEGKL